MEEKYIAFLRGINVGGKNKLKMSELKESLQELGLKNVVTYIQSGNLIFTSEFTAGELMEKLPQKIREDFGLEVPVVLRTLAELEGVQQKNPFIALSAEDITPFHVSFLAHSPEPEDIKCLQAFDSSGDRFEMEGREIYLYCPKGYGRTKLTNTFFEKKLRVSVTTRNWKTVCYMIARASED